MQCDRQLNHPPVDFVIACACLALDRELESCATHSFGDSNVRSALLATTRLEAHIFQRTREGVSDRLPVRHNPGSGILQKTGSKRIWDRKA
jgi:hypothetical protein